MPPKLISLIFYDRGEEKEIETKEEGRGFD